MSLKTRIAWNVSVYVLALLVFFLLSDGEGRFELLLKLMVFFWPLLIVVDALIAHKKSTK
ncbi:MAG: hypothetical protein O9305_14900 [Rhodobacteraceae bacterium]|jgi:hypothetical protein|nr:hypothetical protein [Paracoccaceae bacterium]